MNRRGLLSAAAAIACATLSAATTAAPGAAPAPTPSRAHAPRVRRLVERSLVIDMLAPLRLDLRDDAYAYALSARETAAFRQARITGLHHSLGFGGPDAYTKALEFLAGWQGFVARNADLFLALDTAADFERARTQGKIAVVFGIQNAEQFRSAADVKTFYGLGLRCAQLTYNSQTLIGSGSTEREDGGLSDFGAEIVRAMDDAGMLIDVSHCGDRTTLDAIELARGPIAVTHSNCRALNDHPRLKTDEAIRALAAKGGVFGVTGVRMFVSAREPATVETVVDHIDHVVRLVGIEHVGIGSDADLFGYDALPPDQRKQLHAAYKASYGFRERDDTDGFSGPDKIFELTAALVRRGYSDANIEAILGGNFRRLLGAVWRPSPVMSGAPST